MEGTSLITSLLDSEDTLMNIPLPRGEACLPCRKRKSKCDGTKPVCRQCSRGKRSNDCRYDPSKAWSRNRKLQHRLIQVERRMIEMESRLHAPSTPAPSIPDPHPQFSFDPSDLQGLSSFDILGSGSTTAHSLGESIDTQSLQASGSNSSPEEQTWFEAHGATSASGDSSSGFDSPNETEGICLSESGFSPEFEEILIQAFISHRHQLAFQVDMNLFQPVLSVASASLTIEKAHPSLRNIIFALGCYFSRLTWLDAQEARFVDQALHGLHGGLSRTENLLDLTQSCCLLASYSFIKGHVLQINYHLASAARLATGLGLHQVMSSEYSGPWALNNAISGAQREGGEDIEAAMVFWNLFIIDRLYSVALGVPSTLVDDHRPRNRFRTPLPDRISVSHPPSAPDWGESHSPFSTIFSSGPNYNFADLTEPHVTALYAKISDLFEKASRLSYSSSNDEGFIGLENALSQASTALPLEKPTTEGGSYMDEGFSYTLMTLRTLVHAATVQLHGHLSLKELKSHAKSLTAAEHIIAIIREHWDADFVYFDPILGTAWMSVAEVLLRERMLGHHADVTHDNTVEGQLETVVSAMKRLGALFPVVAIQLGKIERSMTSSSQTI